MNYSFQNYMSVHHSKPLLILVAATYLVGKLRFSWGTAFKDFC